MNVSMDAALPAARVLGICLFLSLPLRTAAQNADIEALIAPAVIPSPLQFNGVSADGLMAQLAFDSTAYDALKLQTHALLTDFPLSADESVILEVKPFEVFTADARIVLGSPSGDVALPRPGLLTLRGRVYGDDDSFVYLALSPTLVCGWLEYRGERHLLSSGPHGSGAPPVIYNLDRLPDGALLWDEFRCRALEIGTGAAREVEPLSPDRGLVGKCLRTEVAVDTDYEYTANRFAGDAGAASAYIAALFGAVASIFERDVLVTLDLSYTRVWTANDDPYTGADQLGEFVNWWNANEGAVPRDIAHYLSGMGGGGVAYLSVVCGVPWNYGMSNVNGFFPYPVASYQGGNWDLMVVSHEIGHNFASPHTHDMTPQVDGCGTGDCSAARGGTIMSYCHICSGGMTNIDLRFHERSINDFMRPHALSRTCLAAYGPEILLQPTASQSRCAGDSVLLLTATSDFAAAFQWYKGAIPLVNGPNLIGATSRALYIPSATVADSASDYRCEVWNPVTGCSTKTAYASVTVGASSTIATQPLSQTLAAGESMILRVETVEAAFLSLYQWRRAGVPLVDDGRIAGAQGSLLHIPDMQAADAGEYDCVLTNIFSFCERTTSVATITVTGGCSGDVNGDNLVDLSDLGVLLSHYGTMSGATRDDGDFDGDGDVDLSDLGVLLAAFGVPC